ncbi:hypothetical protein CASFOL_032763 [Castilleja foliolosa]|uniref:TF-B3 domain-containing protein n=1 Tax=Castilleja foliolosa TaxID=1961234 RepID=A0ABD3C307_9LAMI
MDKPTSSDNSGPAKFKGVVAEPNMHWGPQIYSNQQHVGLGTFKSEMVASMAYEKEGITLRIKPTIRNVHRTDATLHGPSFQARFNMEPVTNMIKNVGSYTPKLSEYLLARAYYNSTKSSHDHRRVCAPKGKLVRLFDKELTPSDVGKLNRLVIPKKLALKHFPKIPGFENKNVMKGNNNDNVDELELVFFDRYMMSWELRYCYWKSSRSFVFTNGWNRFAKGNGLKVNDKVIFSSFELDGRKIFVIDVAYCNEGTRDVKIVKELEMKMDVDEREVTNKNELESKKNELENIGIDDKKGIKLFGFQIQI